MSLPAFGPLLLGQRPQLLHECGKLPVRAEVIDFGLLQRGEIRRCFQLSQRGLFQRFDLVQK